MENDHANPTLVGVVSSTDVTGDWQYEPRPEVFELGEVPHLRLPLAQEPIPYLPDFGPDWVATCEVWPFDESVAGSHTVSLAAMCEARILVAEPRVAAREAWAVVRVPGAGQGTVDGLLPLQTAPLMAALPGHDVWPLAHCPDVDPLVIAVRLTHRPVAVVRVGGSYGLVFLDPASTDREKAETFVLAGFLPPIGLDLGGFREAPEAVWLARWRALTLLVGARVVRLDEDRIWYGDVWGTAPEDRLTELERRVEDPR